MLARAPYWLCPSPRPRAPPRSPCPPLFFLIDRLRGSLGDGAVGVASPNACRRLHVQQSVWAAGTFSASPGVHTSRLITAPRDRAARQPAKHSTPPQWLTGRLAGLLRPGRPGCCMVLGHAQPAAGVAAAQKKPSQRPVCACQGGQRGACAGSPPATCPPPLARLCAHRTRCCSCPGTLTCARAAPARGCGFPAH